MMCKANGGEPSLDLLRSFLNLGRAGDWLTLSNRGGADVPKALTRPVTHFKNWKGSFFYIENKVIPSSFPELLLEDNKFDKKYFKDKIPLLPQMDPLYDQISTYPCSVQTFPDPILYLAGLKTSWKYSPKKPVIYHRGREMDFRSFMVQEINGELNFLPDGDIVENIMGSRNTSVGEGRLSLIGPDAPSYLEMGKRSKVARKRKVAVGSYREDPYRKAQKVSAQASKVAGDASSPIDVDSDPDIHEFLSSKELKDQTDCHWVVAHVTLLSWKQYLKEIKIIFALRRAMESGDTICEREVKKDKAYVKLEKNSWVNGLHREYSRLVLEEKKWITYEQTLSTLRAKVEGLESKGKRLRDSKI
uniref:Uncharacterized protein n=1 Tax=Tanacetum cinerariifolium TaxID=118510 RepID=A0A6L2L3A1_TANCI|nr:hypothetical protein [Tanacetum cinerariifolium]